MNEYQYFFLFMYPIYMKPAHDIADETFNKQVSIGLVAEQAMQETYSYVENLISRRGATLSTKDYRNKL